MGVKLLMLKGLPASGKSTYAKELESQGWVRANKDDIRAERFPHYELKDEKAVIDIEDERIIDGLAEGKNVVVDDTNFKQQPRLEKIASEYDAEFEVLFIDTPLEDCIKRNSLREDTVPVSVIVEMHNKYIAPLRGEEPAIKYDDSLEEAIIVDIDGTLAHVAGDNPRNIYDASRAMEDAVDDAVSAVVGMAYQNGYKVIVVTGRDGAYRKTTEDWLAKHGIEYDELYIRGANDRRKDTEVKKDIYETHIKKRFNVKFVIDDRPSVCRMWRGEGLKVFQVGDPHVEF